jgi:hypothetical protein
LSEPALGIGEIREIEKRIAERENLGVVDGARPALSFSPGRVPSTAAANEDQIATLCKPS